VIENDPYLIPWPPDPHICAYASPGKGRIRRWRVPKLVELAEKNLIKLPK
jgi:hypothetical protein